MSTILHVNASPRGGNSKSLALAEAFLRARLDRVPEAELDVWNLFEEPLPPFAANGAAAKVAAVKGAEPVDDEATAWAEARAVFDRFASADEYVFNVPMWNHGVPYVLKQWIDLITQPGWVFGFHPEHGYSGLLQGKRAFVVYTSGVYRTGGRPGFGSDFHATFFDDWLRFVGISDVTDLYFSGNDLVRPGENAFEELQDRARELAGQPDLGVR